MTMPMAALTDALRNPSGASPNRVDAAALIAMAEAHRVLLLMGAELRAAGTLERWPAEFRAAFASAERDAAAIDCIRQAELATVVDALNAAGVRALLFKGAALAQTHYRAPHLRPRTDTDVLISSPDICAAERALTALGYVPQHETSGELVSYQSHFGKSDRHGVFHAVDLHWKISNRHAFADRIRFEELWSTRRPIAAFGPEVAAVSDVHALLLAIVHRAGHHPGSTNLLWVWDLHALASRMSEQQLSELVQIAADRDLGSIVSQGLTQSIEWFGTLRLERPIGAINQAANRSAKADGIAAGSQADVLRQDLRALKTWRERGRLVREHLFPPVRYIRGKYRARSAFVLPALYAWRIVCGAPRWLRRPDNAG